MSAVLIVSIAAGYGVSPLRADDAVSFEMPIDDHWEVVLFAGQPEGSVHRVKRAVIRDNQIILINESTTRVQTERFGMPAEIVLTESSEETVTGERLRFSARMDIPGSPSRLVTAEVQGDQLLCTIVEGEQNHEFAIDWTPALAAGMRLQSRFQSLPWREGDTLSADIYHAIYGLQSAKFVCLGETEVTLFDGTTRTLTHVQRVSTLSDGTTQTIDHYLALGEGAVVDVIDGGATMERVADQSVINGLLGSVAPTDEVALEGELLEESWGLATIEGNRVGRMERRLRQLERDGTLVRVSEEVFTITMTRFGEEQEMVFGELSEETPEGLFLKSTETMQMPGEPSTTFVAVLEGAELIVTTTVGEEVSEQRFPWTDELTQGMQFGNTLELHDWQPGEEVVTTQYGFGGIGKSTYINRGDVEMTLFDGTTRVLLHIEQQLEGSEGDSSHYYLAPGEGSIIEVHSGMQVEVVPREVATDVNAEVEESGTVINVSLSPSLSPSAVMQATELAFRLTLPGLVASAVANDLRQTVLQIDADTLEVRVTSNPQLAIAEEAAIAVCLESGDYVDLNDPLLQSLAAEGVGEAVSQLDKALALEAFVGEYIADDFQHLFDSASQIAINKAGDCSEHSVLLVALLRLNGIPARTAAGLVIDPLNQKAFGHMWVEACIDGYWMPLDAARSAGGILPSYIKFADWNLLENEADSAQFIQAAGIWQSSLEIEVIDGATAE